MSTERGLEFSVGRSAVSDVGPTTKASPKSKTTGFMGRPFEQEDSEQLDLLGLSELTPAAYAARLEK
jgi:hypothetical protein